ncbi:hypothetical protein EUGRSUZ_H00399 [Eucalyptus grandis]|uniref:Uncharacterized protein n=2 Tax=Eucalyptus grandis TaxID=71139 RepID=A0ACC3JKB3_EUCGR|nr:hypothetical protein EUGRSUZ_H00399 [Eucalyptus grandis]
MLYHLDVQRKEEDPCRATRVLTKKGFFTLDFSTYHLILLPSSLACISMESQGGKPKSVLCRSNACFVHS